VPADAFAGKFVLIGATAVGMGDDYPTPVSGRARPMPGIEISANLLDALLDGRAIVRAGAPANASFSMIPVLLLMACVLLLSPRRALLATAGLIVLTLGFSFAMLKAGVWCAPAAALLGLVLAYPLWSWRRLEATLRYLGAEFLRLDAEPRVLPDDPRAAPPPGTDLVERRIFAVEAAAYRLRAARRFASYTLESLPDATLVTDRNGDVLIANRAAAALFGAAGPEELRAKAIARLIAVFAPKAEPNRSLEWPQLQALAGPVETGAHPSLELVSREGRDLLARSTAYADFSGAAAGWIVSLVDISPLREAERSRDEVLSFLSHDMRSPQSSILALLELHELDPDDNPKEQVHERIAQYARRTLELSEQFLQLARAETKEYELETVDLGMIADEALEEAWAAAEQKHITLSLRFDGEPVPVKADPALLRRALINLLGNAVKYSPEETTTTISVEMRDGMAMVSVADQGYGMSEDNLANLFKRFRRFSRPGQPKAQGAGLGMAFVKTVAERHGGSIVVESTPEIGTTFTLQLPPAP
jgi:signal transduction histidine kinase